jgi:signal transduction histidine kinase
VWYRSLYWRIALGYVAVLAILLGLQALVFLYLSGAGWLPGRSPNELGRRVAADVAQALTANPSLDLAQHVRQQWGHVYQPFAVVMADGRVAAARDVPIPPGLVRAARSRLPGFPGRPGGRGGWPPEGMPRRADPGFPPGPGGPPNAAPPLDDPGWIPPRAGPGTSTPRVTPAPEGGALQPQGAVQGPRGGPGANRSPVGRPPQELFDIEVRGARVGVVAVSAGGPQLMHLLREFGPTLGLIGAALLVVGAAVGSLVIFRPARERMRKLEEAAVALGAGRTTVRAPDDGADEVSALARAFNRMATALEESDAARRRLLADVSHELKTPLTAIRGYVETLSMPELPIDAATRERYLRIVDEETRKLERLVGDLLDVSRLEGGGTTLDLQRVELARVFQRVTDRHERASADKGVGLDVAIDPAAAEVRADPDRLEQAVQNLAANAVRHTPPGGRVTLSARRDGDRVRIAVRDTGPGIAEEHLPRVFGRFYKADSARAADADGGSGLGLSIVKAIVERHGGRVTASNAPEGGAVIEIELRIEN